MIGWRRKDISTALKLQPVMTQAQAPKDRNKANQTGGHGESRRSDCCCYLCLILPTASTASATRWNFATVRALFPNLPYIHDCFAAVAEILPRGLSRVLSAPATKQDT
jgi:hypothetical protein